MPGPGFPVANKILYKYEQDRAYRLHRQKVRGDGGDVKRIFGLQLHHYVMNKLQRGSRIPGSCSPVFFRVAVPIVLYCTFGNCMCIIKFLVSPRVL